VLPEQTYWPLLLALGLALALAGVLVHVLVIAAGLALVAYALLRWLTSERVVEPEAA
jgi:hypothetical protein